MLQVQGALDPSQLERARAVLATAPFVDGKVTAGATARKVKSNQQAQSADERVQALAGSIREILEANSLFRSYVRPAKLSGLLFSRYGPGHEYGMHVDDPVMRAGDGSRFRTDLSFTLFLADPESYEGGELLVENRAGARQVKLRAGGLVVYPSGALHRVNPVTRGERLACVGWVQSLIRREDQRETLFDLGRARASLPEGDVRLLVDKVASNLMRMWADV